MTLTPLSLTLSPQAEGITPSPAGAGEGWGEGGEVLKSSISMSCHHVMLNTTLHPVIASEAWPSPSDQFCVTRLFALLTPSGPPCGRSALASSLVPRRYTPRHGESITLPWADLRFFRKTTHDPFALALRPVQVCPARWE